MAASENNNSNNTFKIIRGMVAKAAGSGAAQFVSTGTFFDKLVGILENSNAKANLKNQLNQTITTIKWFQDDEREWSEYLTKNKSSVRYSANIPQNMADSFEAASELVVREIDKVLDLLGIKVNTSLTVVTGMTTPNRKDLKQYDITKDPENSSLSFGAFKDLRKTIVSGSTQVKSNIRQNNNIQMIANHLQGLVNSIYKPNGYIIPYGHRVLFNKARFKNYKGWIVEGYNQHLITKHNINLRNLKNAKINAEAPVLIEENATEEFPEAARDRIEDNLRPSTYNKFNFNSDDSYFLNYLVNRAKGRENGLVSGDIIYIDDKSNVQINTQVKTTGFSSTNFGIKINQARNIFVELYEYLDKSNEISANELSEILRTFLETEAIQEIQI